MTARVIVLPAPPDPCPHREAGRRVGHSVVTYTCRACGRRWQTRLIAGREPESTP